MSPEPFDGHLVVVGGVAGGMNAATRARRVSERCRITVLERGAWVSFANCGLTYRLGRDVASFDKLLSVSPETHRARFRIDVRTRHEATRVDRANRRVEYVDHATGARGSVDYDRLILAPGSEPVWPDALDRSARGVFPMKQLEDLVAAEAWLEEQRPTRAAVLGGGYIGLELCEALVRRGLRVTVVDCGERVLSNFDPELSAFACEELEAHGVELCVGHKGGHLVLDRERRVQGVVREDGSHVEAGIVFVALGVKPRSELAREAGLSIGESGGVQVDAHGRTSDSHIYCVGDAAECQVGHDGKRLPVPLAGPANRHGRLVGTDAALGASRAHGAVWGTQIVKVFDLALAMTGPNEAKLKAAGVPYDAAYVRMASHAGYYPGATPLWVKLLFEQKGGKLLGAAAVGQQGADKRVDLAAAVLHFGGTVDDLARLDLCYAPPYGNAKDPIHQAAFAAQNQLDGLPTHAPMDELPTGAQLLDVRDPDEFAGGHLPGATNVPVNDLRERLGELDRARPVVAYCRTGQRGYVATRVLLQSGFDARNLRGGYLIARRAGWKVEPASDARPEV